MLGAGPAVVGVSSARTARELFFFGGRTLARGCSAQHLQSPRSCAGASTTAREPRSRCRVLRVCFKPLVTSSRTLCRNRGRWLTFSLFPLN